jgi:tRNA dimethylallyltransferase
VRPESELPAEAPILEEPSFPKETPIPVLVLFGPTASGKTAVLERLFAATGARYPAEVVSADSMQVYRGMDVGTAKPAPDLVARLPHHLIDIRNPTSRSASEDFVRLADEACAIAAAGRLPWSRAAPALPQEFPLGHSSAPPTIPPSAMRSASTRAAGRKPSEELRAVDPASAGRIHPTTIRIRGPRVFRVSGRPRVLRSRAPAADRPSYRFLVWLRRPRDYSIA